MKTQTVKRVWLRLPIRWKLTLWSAFLIFVLFAAYNTVQYVVVERWMIGQEKMKTLQQMSDILNGLLEKEAEFTEGELPRIRSFLDKKNQSGQLIRIVDQQGGRVITVSDGVPEEWTAPVLDGALAGQGSVSTVDSVTARRVIPVTKEETVMLEHEGHSLLVMRSPLTIHSFHGTVEIVKNMDQFQRLTEAIWRVFVWSGLGAVILSGLVGGLLARQLLKPLQAMAETMRSIERNGLQERMAVPDRKDEMADLMRMFNGMMDQVERSFRQQSQFVEDASHELRTPIAIMDGHLSLLLRWGKDDPAALEESLHISYHELTRLKTLVQDLLMLTRAEHDGAALREATPRADRTMLRVVGQMEQLHPGYPFETTFAGFEGREVAVSERHLVQVMTILLDNAVRYSRPGSPVRVTGSITGDEALFAVTDCGIGIPEQELPYVTDRFYRVDKARNRQQGGTGLGLAIAKQLVARYNGCMAIQSKEHEGTTVSISFACRPYSDLREVESNEKTG